MNSTSLTFAGFRRHQQPGAWSAPSDLNPRGAPQPRQSSENRMIDTSASPGSRQPSRRAAMLSRQCSLRMPRPHLATQRQYPAHVSGVRPTSETSRQHPVPLKRPCTMQDRRFLRHSKRRGLCLCPRYERHRFSKSTCRRKGRLPRRMYCRTHQEILVGPAAVPRDRRAIPRVQLSGSRSRYFP